MEPNKCYGYIRVSSDRQDNSLEVQKQRISDYCTFHKLEIAEYLIDENVSGGTEIFKRPQGRKLIDFSIKNIVAIKPDRVFRSVSDALITMDIWNKQNVSLHFADVDGTSLNCKTATGRLMFTMIIANAEFERRITGERTRAVLSHKKANGKAYCGKEFGFDNVDGNRIINLREQETLEIMKELRTQGISFGQIENRLFKMNRIGKNGKFMSAAVIRNLLSKKN